MRKRILCLLLTLLLILSVVSCQKNNEKDAYSIGSPNHFMGINGEGILHEVDGVLWFYDFDSEHRIVLCNKPDCVHEPYNYKTNTNPTCSAVLPDEGMLSGYGLHNDYLYMFSEYNINYTTVYRQRPDGDGRMKLAELDWGVSNFHDIIFSDNRAYFVGVEYIMDEYGTGSSSDQKLVIINLDLENGNVQELTEVKYDNLCHIGQLYLYGDKLYYEYTYYDEGMDFLAENAMNMQFEYENRFLYEIDLLEGKDQVLVNISEQEDTYIGLDSKYIYYQSEDRTKIYSVSMKDSSEKILFEGEDVRSFFLGDTIIFDQNNSFPEPVYICDLTTGKTLELHRTFDETFPFLIYKDLYFILAQLADGEYHVVCISKDDYIEENDNYIIFDGSLDSSDPPKVGSEAEAIESVGDIDYDLLWPGVKKLVLACDHLMTSGVDPQIFIDFNNLLLDKGSAFVVEFITFDSVDYLGYQSELRQLKSSDSQVDLLNTGFGIDGEPNTFPEAVKDDLLWPLDEYLFSVEGSGLYQAFDPKAWEGVKLNGHIYGINDKVNLAFPYYLYINKELQNKYDIQLADEINDLSQLEDALSIIAENEKDIIAMDNYLPMINDLAEYACLDSGIGVKYGENGYPTAFNIFEDQKFVGLAETAYEYIDKGYMSLEDEAYEQVIKGSFFAYISHANPEIYYDGKLMLGEDIIEVNAYRLANDFVIEEQNYVWGIASWSKYREDAMGLMTMINTDQELSNLLRFGIEGRQYELSNGVVIRDEEAMRAPGYWSSPANKMITYPEGLEPIDKGVLYLGLHADAKMSPVAGFTLDETAISDQLSKVADIYDEYEFVYTGKAQDIKDILSQANKELESAGINELLFEINQQLTSWWDARED
ncbi:MAG TPA: DUF3502 domain-containing protein [Bacillota bacterium]|nr:DUF3502 domain-containing protein [Bacillota bacterium]